LISKRLITVLTFNNGVLFRTKLFTPDYRYTANFVDSWSVDEIIILDITRKHNNNTRNNFYKVIDSFSKNCFVPLTVGGWIRNIREVSKLFKLGADKVSINSSAIRNPRFITKISGTFGTQSVVVSIDAKKKDDGNYEVYSNQGKKPISICPTVWAKKVEDCGAGEILITSINNDGWLRGYDIDLCKKIKSTVKIPVLALGGCGNWDHMYQAFTTAKVDAACTQNIYHYTEQSIKSAKKYLKSKGIKVRI